MMKYLIAGVVSLALIVVIAAIDAEELECALTTGHTHWENARITWQENDLVVLAAGVHVFSLPDYTYTYYSWDDPRSEPYSETDDTLISPDGTLMVDNFTRYGQRTLYIKDREGAIIHRYSDDSPQPGPVAWSPDGSQLAFVFHQSTEFSQIVQEYVGGLAVMDVATGEVTPLFHPDGYIQDSVGYYQFHWSPDSSQIAFLGRSPVRFHDTLYVANVETGEIKRYGAVDPISSLFWMQDGAAILFSVSDRMHLLDVATGITRKYIDGRKPAIYTDHIAYLTGHACKTSLIVADVNGENARTVYTFES